MLGRRTGPTGVPNRWRGQLPDLSIQRHLPPLDGYCKVPGGLLNQVAPDLGVITWAALRLRYGDQAVVTTYQELARLLNLGDLTVSAVEKRFRAALGPLLGSWIVREPAYDNLYSYRAVLPESAQRDRYAILRRSDLALMAERGSSHLGTVGAGDLADFCRWQLECGRRGWTADSLRAVGERWGVSHATMRRSRDRLAALGLLEVVSRSGGRHSDLVWLKEVYDPHWTVPSTTTLSTGGAPLSPDRPDLWNNGGGLSTASSAPVGVCGTSMGGGEGLADAHAADVEHFWGVLRNSGRGRCGSSPSGPIKELTGSLADDLPDLGGASAPPLTSVTREIAGAAPAAPRSPAESSAGLTGADPHQTASRLLAADRYLASAPPHFRRVMLARLTSALRRGLLAEHAERALLRVSDEGAFDAECLLLQRALQQAWADQRAGMCRECGSDPTAHAISCTHFAYPSVEPEDSTPETLTAGARFGPTTKQATDPLAILLQHPGSGAPGQTDSDVDLEVAEIGSAGQDEVVDWMVRRLAGLIVDSSDREVRLRTLWSMWRTRLPPGRREQLDHAAEQIRYALTRSAS